MTLRIRNKAEWFALVVIPLAFVLSYWSTILRLVRQWIANDNYSHGLMILPIVLCLVWYRRADLKAVKVRPDWRALLLILIGLGVGVVGELGAELFTTRLSMLVVAVGLAWLIFGSQVVRVLRFPLAFLFLMLPLPGFVYRLLTLPLQLISTVGAVRLLNLMGISAYREGNVIDLGIANLQVVEACNGLRYLLPLFTFGILYAYLAQTVTWKRITLVMAAFPIAILANVLRLAGAGISVMYWGSSAAEGFFHAGSAIGVIGFCALLLVLLNVILKKLPGGTKPEKPRSISKEPYAGALKRITWSPLLASLMVLVVSGPVTASLGQVPPLPAKRPLSDFPLEFQGWQGNRSEMPASIWERVGAQDYTIIDYSQKNESDINFYVAYYQYQRKAGDFIHSPRLCLTGSGWYIEEDRVRQVFGDNKDGLGLKINELLINKSGEKSLVYFWYQGRGRNFTNEFAAKFYLVWDGLFRRRTDGALVRLGMRVETGKRLADVRMTLDRFALAASEALEEFLPN